MSNIFLVLSSDWLVLTSDWLLFSGKWPRSSVFTSIFDSLLSQHVVIVFRVIYIQFISQLKISSAVFSRWRKFSLHVPFLWVSVFQLDSFSLWTVVILFPCSSSFHLIHTSYIKLWSAFLDMSVGWKLSARNQNNLIYSDQKQGRICCVCVNWSTARDILGQKLHPWIKTFEIRFARTKRDCFASPIYCSHLRYKKYYIKI